MDDIDDKWGLSEAFSEAYLSQDSAQEQSDGWALVQSRLRIRARRRRLLSYAAALIPAAVLLGIGGSRLLSPAGISGEPVIAVIESPIAVEPEDNVIFDAENQLIADASTAMPIPPAAAVSPSPAATASVEAAGTVPSSGEAETAASETIAAAEPVAAAEPTETVRIAEAAEEAGRTDMDLTDELSFPEDDAPSGRRHRISLGLNARMNSEFDVDILPRYADYDVKYMADSSPLGDAAAEKYLPLKGNGYERADFDHYLPIATGLSLAVELTDRLYAETGLNYTLLRSDVKMPGSLLTEEQKLHFIGIPLKLFWKAADFGSLSLYTGAGGQVEKCVKASLGDESVSEKALQWSLNVSAGAQYALGRHISLYLQPEYSLHLNDTRLKTIRSEDRTEFTLRCGLRFNL